MLHNKVWRESKDFKKTRWERVSNGLMIDKWNDGGQSSNHTRFMPEDHPFFTRSWACGEGWRPRDFWTAALPPWLIAVSPRLTVVSSDKTLTLP